MYLHFKLYVVDISGNRSHHHLSLLILFIFRLFFNQKVNITTKNSMIIECKIVNIKYNLFVKEIDNTIEDFKHYEIKGTYFMQKES